MDIQGLDKKNKRIKAKSLAYSSKSRLFKTPTNRSYKQAKTTTKSGKIFLYDMITGYIFVTPVALYFLIFLLYPLIAAIYYSFTSWNMRTAPVWVGLNNYTELFFNSLKYPDFWASLWVTIHYTILSVPITLVVALTLAMMINSLRRGQDFFKVSFFIPVITADAAVGSIWRWIFDPIYGLLNVALKSVGLKPENWLGDAAMIIPALVMIAVWQCGVSILVFLAGLKNISAEYYEAASIDGAGVFESFFYITLPMLKPTTFYLTVVSIINGFQAFSLVYVLLGAGGGAIGGPKQAGLMYVLNIYNHAFRYNEMGIASAMSVFLLLIVLVVTFAQFRFLTQSYE